MISRLYCIICKAETLHQGMSCVHCRHSMAIPRVERKRGFNNSTSSKRPYSVQFRGEYLSLKQIAKREGIAYATLTERFRNGLRGEQLVEKVTPLRSRARARAA